MLDLWRFREKIRNSKIQNPTKKNEKQKELWSLLYVFSGSFIRHGFSYHAVMATKTTLGTMQSIPLLAKPMFINGLSKIRQVKIVYIRILRKNKNTCLWA